VPLSFDKAFNSSAIALNQYLSRHYVLQCPGYQERASVTPESGARDAISVLSRVTITVYAAFNPTSVQMQRHSLLLLRVAKCGSPCWITRFETCPSTLGAAIATKYMGGLTPSTCRSLNHSLPLSVPERDHQQFQPSAWAQSNKAWHSVRLVCLICKSSQFASSKPCASQARDYPSGTGKPPIHSEQDTEGRLNSVSWMF
jgi:hypothetical protein